MFVDRKEFEDTQFLTCPLPKCAHSWCKLCQQPATENSDPPHSCDGTNELNHLMGAHGWKRCPGTDFSCSGREVLIPVILGCGTPTEKITGCDHMTVSLPASLNVIYCVNVGCVYSVGHQAATCTSSWFSHHLFEIIELFLVIFVTNVGVTYRASITTHAVVDYLIFVPVLDLYSD